MINFGSYAAQGSLPLDWRVFGFALILAFAVTFLFGLTPALRASAVRPISALRGGEDARSQQPDDALADRPSSRLCFVVHLAAGLFATSLRTTIESALGFRRSAL